MLDFAVRTNRLAIRCPEGTITEPRRDVTHVIHCIGDSYTMGWGVKFEESYPYYLGQIAGSEFECLNLGDSGYGLTAAWEKSELLANEYPPEMLIYVFDTFDFDDDQETKTLMQRGNLRLGMARAKHFFCEHTLLANIPSAIAMQLVYQPISDEFAKPAFAEETYPIEALADEMFHTLNAAADRLTEPVYNVTTNTLVELKRSCDDLGRRLVVALFATSELPSIAIYKIAQAHDIEILCFPSFPAWRIPGDGHLNATGNRQLAAFLAARNFDSGALTERRSRGQVATEPVPEVGAR
ncbi:MAG: hypothetical protein AB7U73_07975 [Pirellulales bacterium]